ncbi:hypothetical protein KC340_g1401 [Hortaea werneckii]|nr:hypothetical protein KC342_g1089 [Hortaea werneckii]KAI7107095.1 hypothetical protein KC339_g2625 [Hortaea werneckii]KAI7243604.1 hypothetical protein KC365_g2167 [Hortaea werneckii]KAI7337010.1 hypothetical protein KC340_g1401 [Hortaea werneckii]KAI7387496.1 hypothetical protein KC328_g9397 [Hortaea werneckii]
MHFLSFLAFAATSTAAALPDGSHDLVERASACTRASAATLAAAKSAFTSAGLVPDLVPQFNPDIALKASWNGKQVQLGNTFNTLQTLTEPQVSFTAEPGQDPANTKYTYFLVDPDAPGPEAPILADFLHLIVSDAQPSCISNQKRKTVASYMPLTPLSVSPHRYTFLVYRQPPNYTPPPSLMYLPGVRNNFDLNGYVEKAGLIGPLGGNFMRQGLAQDVCAITPNCTQDGTGYPSS